MGSFIGGGGSSGYVEEIFTDKWLQDNATPLANSVSEYFSLNNTGRGKYCDYCNWILPKNETLSILKKYDAIGLVVKKRYALSQSRSNNHTTYPTNPEPRYYHRDAPCFFDYVINSKIFVDKMIAHGDDAYYDDQYYQYSSDWYNNIDRVAPTTILRINGLYRNSLNLRSGPQFSYETKINLLTLFSYISNNAVTVVPVETQSADAQRNRLSFDDVISDGTQINYSNQQTNLKTYIDNYKGKLLMQSPGVVLHNDVSEDDVKNLCLDGNYWNSNHALYNYAARDCPFGDRLGIYGIVL